MSRRPDACQTPTRRLPDAARRSQTFQTPGLNRQSAASASRRRRELSESVKCAWAERDCSSPVPQ
eukprot:3447517-Prymnesium_polylepis.1